MNIRGFAKPDALKIDIEGVPSSIPASIASVFTSRLDRAARELIESQRLKGLEVTLRFGNELPVVEKEAAGIKAPATQRPEPGTGYVCREPLFSQGLLVLSDEVQDRLDAAMRMLDLQPLLFDEWGLREIEPRPKTALNFYGPPGTGKTLAAHTVAARMGRRILSASYADIESMYHGEGPKNVVQLFRSAEEEHAVLFLDEADSLLSKRLTNITQGSEQAINSMRSQLLISLDAFQGLVIFATNLVENYDPAFDTRVEHIHFSAPDRTARAELWRRHLPARLPLDSVSVEELAESSDGLVGRQIKTAVIAAAVAAARQGRGVVGQRQLLDAVASVRASGSRE